MAIRWRQIQEQNKVKATCHVRTNDFMIMWHADRLQTRDVVLDHSKIAMSIAISHHCLQDEPVSYHNTVHTVDPEQHTSACTHRFIVIEFVRVLHMPSIQRKHFACPQGFE